MIASALTKDFSPLIIFNDNKIKLTDFSFHDLLTQAKNHKLVILRGFPELSKDSLLNYCESNAKLLYWEFGPVMEMRTHTSPKNYLFTESDVPLHWDGAFHIEPRFLFFHCIHAPQMSDGGETIFIHTEKAWDASSKVQKKHWQKYKLQYSTAKLAHYGGTIVRNLVQIHPETGKTILRFAEPVTEDYLNPVNVSVIDKSAEESSLILQELSIFLRQKSLTYQHQWEDGDYLIADNFSLLHGRNAFNKNSPRHLRRIQIL